MLSFVPDVSVLVPVSVPVPVDPAVPVPPPVVSPTRSSAHVLPPPVVAVPLPAVADIRSVAVRIRHDPLRIWLVLHAERRDRMHSGSKATKQAHNITPHTTPHTRHMAVWHTSSAAHERLKHVYDVAPGLCCLCCVPVVPLSVVLHTVLSVAHTVPVLLLVPQLATEKTMQMWEMEPNNTHQDQQRHVHAHGRHGPHHITAHHMT